MGRQPRESTITFSRGLETVRSPMAPRASMEAMDNVWLSPSDKGAIECMPGYAKVNSSEISSATFKSAGLAVKSDGTRYNYIGYENGAQKRIVTMAPAGTTTNIFTEATSPAITVGDFSVVTIDNYAMFFNGTDAPFKQKLADNSISAIGLTRPATTGGTSAVTAAADGAASGNVKGTVAYYIASISSSTESALSEKIGPVDCGDGDTVTLTFGTAHDTVTYRVYRTLANQVQPWFVGEVTVVDPGTLTFQDDTADRDLTGYPFLHGDQPPAAITSAVIMNDRIWGITGDSNLYWSDLANPESFWDQANGNKAPINEDDGDVCVALARDPSGIIIFKENHIYRAVGTIPSALQIQEVSLATQDSRSVGLPSRTALTNTQGGLAFYWNRGVYILAGGSIQKVSDDIEDDLLAIRNQDEALGVFLGYYPKRRLLYVSVPLSSGATPTHTYVYDTDSGQWIGRMPVGFRGFLATEDANGDEEFWALGTGNGFVYKFDSGTTYAGTAISASLELPPFYGPNPASIKTFLYVDVHFAPQASGSFTVDLEVDGKSSDTDSYSVNQVQASTDRWSRRVNFGVRGRELKVTISSAADQPAWKIYGITYGYHNHGSISR